MLMADDDLEVKLVSECFVRPKYEVEESKKPHHLIGLDLFMLRLRYIELALVYNKSSTKEFDINSFVDTMKASFSETLVHYYPLAGRFSTVKYEDEHACSIHVDCNKGPGARFIHASCEQASVSAIVDRLPGVPSLFDLGETGLVSYDGHTQALVSLQVTELEDGIVVGFTMNHSVGDAASLFNFVTSLSEIFLSTNNDRKETPLSHSPVFSPFLPEGCNLIQKLKYFNPDELITRANKNNQGFEARLFNFSRSSILKLKEQANSDLGSTGHGMISSFQAFAALVWISINRARKTPAEEMTTCAIPIDCRARLCPPLSPNHFSNQAQAQVITKNVGELLGNGLGSASLLLHNHIVGYDHQLASQRHKELMENPRVLILPNESESKRQVHNHVHFIWGPRFDIYGVDFGLGKVVASPNGANYNREGTVIVKSGTEGRGSMALALSLFRDNMIALESDKDFMAYVS